MFLLLNEFFLQHALLLLKEEALLGRLLLRADVEYAGLLELEEVTLYELSLHPLQCLSQLKPFL